MLTSLLPVRSLLLAIFMMMAGSGFLTTLISIRMERAGTGAPLIGLVSAAYFAGLTVGSLQVSHIIARVGHIRAFAAFISVFSASSLAYAIHRDVAFWMALRFVDGFCVAGIYICIESWLNQHADHRNRGTVLAGYMIALYSGQAIGQFLLNVSDAKPSLPFMAAAILLSLALLPVVLTRTTQPAIGDLRPLSIRRLYAISPLGVVGAALTGMMLGAFYALGAVYLRRLGMDLSATASFMSLMILGGVVFQWPLGRISDVLDRRLVIIGGFAFAFLTCGVLVMTGGTGPHMVPLGILFGGVSFALYPLCVAHANDRLTPEERIGASGGLVLSYSMGAVAGPLTGSIAMAVFGAEGLFLLIGACAFAAAIFGLWRLWAGSTLPSEKRTAYQSLPRTTPMAAVLDPRAESSDRHHVKQ